MPLIIRGESSTKDILKSEGIKVYDTAPEGVIPRKILLLNLMPEKQETELDYYRALLTEDVWLEFKLVKMSNLIYKHTPQEYMNRYYEDISLLMERDEYFDGMLVSGAPLERFDFDEILYWDQLTVFFRWADCHVRSALYICWSVFARVFYNWGIHYKHNDFQWSGIYHCRLEDKGSLLVDDSKTEILMPVSRPLYLVAEELRKAPTMKIIANSDIVGAGLFMAHGGRHIFMLNHPEYSIGRLDFEYKRDLGKGKNPICPINYYENDDPSAPIIYSWLPTRQSIYLGWLRQYVCNSSLDSIPILPATKIKL